MKILEALTFLSFKHEDFQSSLISHLLQKMMDVLKFLRLPHMHLTSRQVKIHSGPLWKHIKNWDDVNKALKGTVYEGFLHTDY